MQLVTGGSGFIGRRLCAALRPQPVRVLARRPAADAAILAIDLATASAETLLAACEGVDTVYHCAGHAHAWRGHDTAEVARHWQINYEATRKLAEAAGRSGVRRLVFLSTVKAMGEPGPQCVDERWLPPPETPYGLAKRAAEQAVLDAGAKYGMHAVNLRLAMVYGRGGRGNLERMAAMIRRGWFPPLPETHNKRSLVHVDDVVAALQLTAERPEAAGGTYIVAHPVAHSGRELYDHIRAALGCAPAERAVPAGVLKAAARCGDVLGRFMRRRMPFDTEALEKLLGWACYSSERITRELGWRARVSLSEGLADSIGPENR